MRSTTEIEAESAKLYELMANKDRWNSKTLQQMAAQIEVLDSRMTYAQIEAKWYRDETEEEYHDGDNNLYHELVRTVNWMRGEKGYKAPSEDAL